MDPKVFNVIADTAFNKVLSTYESENDIDTSNIKSDEDFFEYVNKRIESVRAHNERYTDELVRGIINFYENRTTD